MLGKPHTQLRPAHGLALLGLVLLVHLFVLGNAQLHGSPQASQQREPLRFETRQVSIELLANSAAKPNARNTKPVAQVAKKTHTPTQELTTSPSNSNNRPAPIAESQALTSPTVNAPIDLSDPSLTASVSLPARSASGVDLPPFNRQHPSEAQLEITHYAPPHSALLSYDVKGIAKGFNYSAWAELLWKTNASHYEARLEVGAFLLGSRIQTSRGTLGDEGLSPERFGDKTRSELAAHFQRDKGIISFSANSPDAPLLKGAQDRLSIVLQLSSLLAGDPTRYPAGTVLSFQTASQREAEVWQFVVGQEEVLDLPYGQIAAIKLNRAPRREFDQHIELWFAPQLGFLPVRLRITNANGDAVDQLLKNAEKPAP